MRKFMYTILVFTFTLLTVIAMLTYQADNTTDVSNSYTEYEEQLEVDDGAGYIFDDYGKNINIKLEEKKE